MRCKVLRISYVDIEINLNNDIKEKSQSTHPITKKRTPKSEKEHQNS